jgi:triacylglycerol lipase
LGAKLDMALAVLNGLVGDHLVRTHNALATELECIHKGEPLPTDRAAFARALPSATPRVAILVHGLMCTEGIWKFPDGSDYGTLLARDLGFTPLAIRYNSGRAIADNGEALAQWMESLPAAYPVPIEEILLLGFSMGGLVIRSACHTGKLSGHRWLSLVKRVIYLGTPHRGAPFERAGRVVARVLRTVPDPYTRLIADIGDLRSDGVKDLGDADLRHEDRARTRLSCRFSLRDPRHPVPLLPEIRHYLVAGALASYPQLALWFGDSIVPIPSATADICIDTARLALPPDHVRVLDGFSHIRLAHDPAVYAQIRAWCEAES